MKKLLTILLLCFLLFSCKEEETCIIPEEKPLYKKGDIVYIKPDSIRAIITYINRTHSNGNKGYTYDIDFYVMSQRYQDSYVDTIYFYNNKKLKK